MSGSFPERHAFKGFPWIWTSFLYYRASLLPPSCLSLNFLFLLIDSGFSLIHFSSLRDLGLLIPGTLPRLGNHSPSKQLSFSFLKISFYKSLVYLLCCDSFRCTVKQISSTYTYILSLFHIIFPYRSLRSIDRVPYAIQCVLNSHLSYI